MSPAEECKSLIVDIGKGIEKRFNELQGDIDQKVGKLRDDYVRLNAPGILFGDDDGPTGNREETKAFMSYLRSGRESELQQKGMSTTSDPDGGYLVAPQIEGAISKYLRARSPMRRLARVVPIGAGAYKMPVARGQAGYAWVGETEARGDTDATSLALVSIPTREIYAQPKITQTLLDDNEFDLENWLIEELAESFGDGESDAFINGDGIARPRGLFTYDTAVEDDAARDASKFQYIATGASGGFNATDPVDALISLVYAVKPQYRAGARWLISPEVLEIVRKLKNPTTKEYIWQESAQAGQPATLLGYAVEEDENIPSVAAGSLSAAFGDFSRVYTITDRSSTMLRDPYTAKPYVRFYTTKRVGGGAGRDFRAVKFLKFAAS